LDSDGDLKHFDPEFVKKQLSPVDGKSLGEIRDYDGFSYEADDMELNVSEQPS
jgi:hypothetical protein